MTAERIRVGFVGAGDNTRKRHIPGFVALSGVELVGVVNSSPGSTARVSKEFDIPTRYASWQDLVAAPDVDAVCIGTWPELHAEVTIAALAAGKHVLTEARIARNVDEAKAMQQAAADHPDRIAQIVPSPYGMECGPAVSNLVKKGFLGELRELIVVGADDTFWDYTMPMHPRQDRQRSGNNILSMGILHETALRWAPPPTRLFAQTHLFEPTRPIPSENRIADVTVPDSVQVLTELEGGGRGIYHISGISLFGPGKQIHLYGSRGTIKMHFSGSGERVLLGHAGDADLKSIDISDELRGAWAVEKDFIESIRTGEPQGNPDFAIGVSYMSFVDAVHESARTNAPISL